MRKFGLVLVGFMLFLASAFAGTANPEITNISKAMSNLCYSLKNMLPVVSMLMVVVAGVIYAAGQIMGAETRARANVWATAALTGALIGLLIYAVAPSVLSMLYYGNSTQDISTFCNTYYP